MFDVLLLHAAAFLLGSVPTGYVIGRMSGVDVRLQGSGNTGATNVVRVLGRKAGAATLAGDMLKGILAVLLVYLPLPGGTSDRVQVYSAWLGFAAVAGHCFSPFLGWRGGKGVATGFGVFLVLAPLEALTAACLFAALLRIFGYVSLGSIAAALSLPIILTVEAAAGSAPYPPAAAALLTALTITLRHSSNISRLRMGTEKKFAFSRTA